MTEHEIETVWRMRALCASKSKDGKPQLVYYGLGVNGFMGGVFGQGLDENIRLAYDWLIENYNDGDEIFIFGFSRGAYTARSLAGLIAMDGVLKAIPDRGERTVRSVQEGRRGHHLEIEGDRSVRRHQHADRAGKMAA